MSYYLMTNPGYMLGTILVGIAMYFLYIVRQRLSRLMRNIVVDQIAVELLGHRLQGKY